MEEDFLALLPSRSKAARRCTFPSVSVPVLSEQRTSILPMFSMEAKRLMMAFSWAMRLAPLAKETSPSYGLARAPRQVQALTNTTSSACLTCGLCPCGRGGSR